MSRFLYLFLLLTLTANAENFYFRYALGSGARNGSSWTDAFAFWTDITWGPGAGQLGAGDTVWISGATTINQPLQLLGNGTPAQRIYFKRARANETACTSAAGWSASFDAQVVWNSAPAAAPTCINAFGNGDYVTIDGMIWEGIKMMGNHLAVTQPNNTAFVKFYDGASSSIDGVEFINIEMTLTATNVAIPAAQEHEGFAISGPGGNSNKGLTIRSCHIHHMANPCKLSRVTHLLFEKNVVHDIASVGAADNHGNTMHLFVGFLPGYGATLRHNLFYSNSNDGIYLSASTPAAGIRSTNVWMYGNVFRDCNFSGAKIIQIALNVTDGFDQLHFWNNTFVNNAASILVGGCSPEQFAQGCFNGNIQNSSMKNNIFYNAGTVSVGHFDHDFNWWQGSSAQGEPNGIPGGATDPFLDLANRDLRIKDTAGSPFARDEGVNLGAPYNIDFNGLVRGSGGSAWDIGAYESTATGGGGEATNQPPVITDVQIIERTPWAVTVGWMVSESATNEVRWGTTAAYGSTNSSSAFTAGPVLLITNLSTATTYYMQAASRDNSNALTASLNFMFQTAPVHTNLTNIQFEAGVLCGPGSPGSLYTSNFNGYITITNQASPLTVANSGTANFWIYNSASNSYTMSLSNRAPAESQNSLWVNIDAVPGATNSIFDVTNLTSGADFEARTVTWRGGGTFDIPLIVPKIWPLDTGFHSVQFVGREGGMDLDNFTLTATASAIDDIAPVITVAATVISIGATSATVTWTTDEASDSAVDVGLTTAYGSVFSSTDQVTSHSVPLSGLTRSTLYHYRVRSCDASGNCVTNTDGTFTTGQNLRLRIQ